MAFSGGRSENGIGIMKLLEIMNAPLWLVLDLARGERSLFQAVLWKVGNVQYTDVAYL